jgi:hypothetical protein
MGRARSLTRRWRIRTQFVTGLWAVAYAVCPRDNRDNRLRRFSRFSNRSRSPRKPAKGEHDAFNRLRPAPIRRGPIPRRAPSPSSHREPVRRTLMPQTGGDAALIAEAVRLEAQGKSQRQIAAELGKPRHWVRFTALAAEGKANHAITDVDLQMVRPHPCARSIDTQHVRALAGSILAVGLLEPVIMRRSGDGFEVMAGLHRVAAFRELGRDTIAAIIQDVDDLTAQLVLIDENLCRHDLSPAERAMAVTRRKEVYLQLHPETAHGGDRKSAGSSRRTGATRKAIGSRRRRLLLPGSVSGPSSATRRAARSLARTYSVRSPGLHSIKGRSSTRWLSCRRSGARG